MQRLNQGPDWTEALQHLPVLESEACSKVHHLYLKTALRNEKLSMIENIQRESNPTRFH